MATKSAGKPEKHAAKLFRAITSPPERLHLYKFSEIQDLEPTQQVLASEPAVQVSFVLHTLERVTSLAKQVAKNDKHDFRLMNLIHENKFPREAALVCDRLLRRSLPFSEDDLTRMVNWTADTGHPSLFCMKYLPALVARVEKFAKSNRVSAPLSRSVEQLAGFLRHIGNAGEHKLAARLETVQQACAEANEPRHSSAPRAAGQKATAPAKPSDESQKQAGALYRALETQSPERVRNYSTIEQLEATQQVLSAAPEVQACFVRLTLDQIGSLARKMASSLDDLEFMLNLAFESDYPAAAVLVVVKLLRRTLPFNTDDIAALLNATADTHIPHTTNLEFVPILVGYAERFAKDHEITDQIRDAIDRLVEALGRVDRSIERALAARLRNLRQDPTQIPIRAGEAWADSALEDMKGLKSPQKAAWNQLLTTCANTSGGQPSAKWLKEARSSLKQLGHQAFRKHLLAWFPLVEKPRTQRVPTDWRWTDNWQWYICDSNAEILKGLVWCCALQEDTEISRALAVLAISSYKKLPGIGPRWVKVGNACVWALGNMPGMEGVAQLAILGVRVKFGTAQKCIEKALVATAKRVGLPREELDEMAVPSYGLTEVGLRREALGDSTAELAVSGSSTELRWFRADGKRQASVPAAVQKGFADDLKELKQAKKDIERMLPAQSERLDQLHLAQKSWAMPIWRERYLDHPLVGTLARRLIWQFSTNRKRGDGVFSDGHFVDADDRPLDWVDGDTRVELWHPVGHSADEIRAWRQWFETHHVRQPFKQAHREVYLLTDAERQTNIYSNRFAAHILRQHQFNALCAARGWKSKLRLMVDDEYPPATLPLPKWNLRAEFWIEGIGNDYGTDTNETGVYYRVSTDQVRFYHIESPQVRAHASGGGYSPSREGQPTDPVPLEQIPPLVLSEVLRDVDLFVGVASVANDPNWADGGPGGRYRDYWTEYAFGDLNETAKTRRAVLERLIPRLSIADRCSFSDRFLVVRGELRTYSIHLGSGNIQMEPNNQYLCIVKAPERGDGGRVFLPFEGDGTLAVILSKAFMLAEDRKITDTTILSQIRR